MIIYYNMKNTIKKKLYINRELIYIYINIYKCINKKLFIIIIKIIIIIIII